MVKGTARGKAKPALPRGIHTPVLGILSAGSQPRIAMKRDGLDPRIPSSLPSQVLTLGILGPSKPAPGRSPPSSPDPLSSFGGR